MAEAPPSTLPLPTTVSLSRGEAGLALHVHRDLFVSLTSDVSELLAVSEHTEEVETTHVPVETPLINPPSQGCTTLPGINSVSLDLDMANQVVQAASSSADYFADYLYQTPYRGFIFAPPPPLLLNSGLVGMGPRFPMVSQPFSGLTGAPGGIILPAFPTFPVNPQVPSMGSGQTFPFFGYWIGSTGKYLAESRTSIFSGQPSSSFLDWVVSDPFTVDEVEEEMDASCSLLHPTLSEAGVGHADPSTPPDLQSYDYIFSVVLKDLGNLELLVRDLPKPRSSWELDQQVQVKSGAP